MLVCFLFVAREAAGASSTWLSRSEEHTSELQSQSNLVCRLLLEKKKQKQQIPTSHVHRSEHPHLQSRTSCRRPEHQRHTTLRYRRLYRLQTKTNAQIHTTATQLS